MLTDSTETFFSVIAEVCNSYFYFSCNDTPGCSKSVFCICDVLHFIYTDVRSNEFCFTGCLYFSLMSSSSPIFHDYVTKHDTIITKRLSCSSKSDFDTFLSCIQEIGVSEEPSADQTDLSASPPPPYVPPPSLSLSDITAHEPQDRLGHSDVTESLNNPVEEGDSQDRGTVFEFDDKEEDEGEELSRVTTEQNERRDQSLEGDECDGEQRISKSTGTFAVNPKTNSFVFLSDNKK